MSLKMYITFQWFLYTMINLATSWLRQTQNKIYQVKNIMFKLVNIFKINRISVKDTNPCWILRWL